MNKVLIVGGDVPPGQAAGGATEPSAAADAALPPARQLLEIIAIQAEIAKLGLDLGSVMALVVERCVPLLAADGAVIELAEDDEMVYRAAAGIAAPQLGLRLKRASSLSGRCMRAGEALICADSETDQRVDLDACRKVGLRSMVVLPLRHRGVAVGVLKVLSRAPDSFSLRDAALLALMSEVVAAAMFFATKYDKDALFHRATHDGLTGLANRSLFMDRLRNAIARHRSDGRQAAVLMIDMDGLKTINDRCGHRIGDAVLREFAHRLESVARVSDTVARLGGDEFGVVLAPVDLDGKVREPQRRFLARLEEPFVFEGQAYHLCASFGGAMIPADGADADGLLEVADRRMYEAKRRAKRAEGRPH